MAIGTATAAFRHTDHLRGRCPRSSRWQAFSRYALMSAGFECFIALLLMQGKGQPPMGGRKSHPNPRFTPCWLPAHERMRPEGPSFCLARTLLGAAFREAERRQTTKWSASVPRFRPQPEGAGREATRRPSVPRGHDMKISVSRAVWHSAPGREDRDHRPGMRASRLGRDVEAPG